MSSFSYKYRRNLKTLCITNDSTDDSLCTTDDSTMIFEIGYVFIIWFQSKEYENSSIALF